MLCSSAICPVTVWWNLLQGLSKAQTGETSVTSSPRRNRAWYCSRPRVSKHCKKSSYINLSSLCLWRTVSTSQMFETFGDADFSLKLQSSVYFIDFILFLTVTVITPDSTTNVAQAKKLLLQWLISDNWEIFAELNSLLKKLFPRIWHTEGDFISTLQVRFILASGAWIWSSA